MAARPRVQVSTMSPLAEDASPTPASTTASNASPFSEPASATTTSPATPARGKETATMLRQKLRSPQLVHVWDFWHEKPLTDQPSTSDMAWQTVLTHLHTVVNVRDFWSVFNNLPLANMVQRTSIHLFHKSVQPIWEDPRNARGGAWTFRVPRDKSAEFWKEVCMLAVGEQLQEAVADPERTSFFDDICGVSFNQRFGASLVSVWNRDGDHAAGIERLRETIMSSLSEELVPKQGTFYYKKHSDHAGFKANGRVTPPAADSAATAVASEDVSAVPAATELN